MKSYKLIGLNSKVRVAYDDTDGLCMLRRHDGLRIPIPLTESGMYEIDSEMSELPDTKSSKAFPIYVEIYTVKESIWSRHVIEYFSSPEGCQVLQPFYESGFNEFDIFDESIGRDIVRTIVDMVKKQSSEQNDEMKNDAAFPGACHFVGTHMLDMLRFERSKANGSFGVPA